MRQLLRKRRIRAGLISSRFRGRPDKPGDDTERGAKFSPEADARNGVFAYGAAAGLGVDVALLPNVFLRGEWEFVQFAPLQGDHIHINTVRTALGLKF